MVADAGARPPLRNLTRLSSFRFKELGQQRRALRRQHGMQGKGHGVGSTGRDPAL